MKKKKKTHTVGPSEGVAARAASVSEAIECNKIYYQVTKTMLFVSGFMSLLLRNDNKTHFYLHIFFVFVSVKKKKSAVFVMGRIYKKLV